MTNIIQPTRILIVGGGGREHALAWKLGNEPGVNEVTVGPGSDAIAREPRVRVAPVLDPLDPAAVVALARERAAELVVIGPEAALAAAVGDALIDARIPVFGPSAAAARIESSKAFCRELASAAGVPMAAGRAFDADDRDAAIAFSKRFAAQGVVIKADGLAAGKGVVVCESVEAAASAIAAVEGPFIVEERLVGPEASVIAIADGQTAIALPIARDHKRLGDHDTGPNTGGMGAVSPVADLPDDHADEILARFHLPVLAELSRRGTPFRGALYAGLILTTAGPRLLEFNARFGDPETQAIVPRLAGPLAPLLLAAARGALGTARPPAVLPGSVVAIVLAAAGYPAAPARGVPIDGLDAAAASGALVFHAGTRRDADGTWRTDGGRVLSVVGRGADVAAARAVAEAAADGIAWPGLQRRRDIGSRVVAGGAARPEAVGAGR
ncbi:MAG: phosphoribosylamine---glycine ligase [Chloroflexota bacterium]|jgi:phosphoribosylamine--glycine ligase|nr:phosphoribosylamine---glycine ligase [Chloroflexota bacterium]